MIDLLAIAGRVLASLVIFSVGLYLVNVTFGIITRSRPHQGRFLGHICIAIIALIATIALQQIRTPSVINNVASGQVEVALSRTHRTNVSLGGTNVKIAGGGYVTGIYLHPLKQDLVYIKTDVGGFYRWNPVDQSWVPLTEHLPLDQSRYYCGEALALDPKNPNIIYIAGGSYVWEKPGTIFKSTDQGATWTKLNLDLKMGGNEHLRWVGERLAVNPFNSNDIFFGSRQEGLWKSKDAGATWNKVLSFSGTPTAGIGITAIAFDKQVPGVVYSNAYGDGIYKSTNTGVTWSKVAGSPLETNRISIASNGVLYVTHKSGVSKYAKGAWSNITPDKSAAVFNGLSVNPANPNDMLVSLGETKSVKIYRSINGGATWTEKKASLNHTVPWWYPDMFAPWTSAIEFDPKVAGRVWLTDWNGIWRTEDINVNPVAWTNYEKGHEQLVIFALASPPSGPLLLSGVADLDGFYHNNGLDASPSKTFSDAGKNGPWFQDTYSIAYSESTPSRMVRVGGHQWNSTYTGATSQDAGLTWKQFKSWPSANTMPLRVAMSATDPSLFVVTVSGGQALRTADNGASWQAVQGLPNGDQGPWYWSQSLAADKVDGNTFYYYAGGKVYRSTDGGKAFEAVNSSLPSEYWHSLKTVPGVEGEVWVSLNWNGLYRSTNGGKMFSQIAGVERAYLFAFGKPQTGSTIPALYVYGKITGMGEGIFRSLDRGKTWTSIGDQKKPIGKDPKVMEASRQEFGLVFIGTGGRGIYYGTK